MERGGEEGGGRSMRKKAERGRLREERTKKEELGRVVGGGGRGSVE